MNMHACVYLNITALRVSSGDGGRKQVIFYLYPVVELGRKFRWGEIEIISLIVG